jgi:hypothetical protein
MLEWLKNVLISILTFFLSFVGMKVEDVFPVKSSDEASEATEVVEAAEADANKQNPQSK